MSRTDQVVDGIKSMLLDGRLAPGDRLPVEKDLAADLGVSRGSLREGLRALATLGIVDSRQGDGTYITSLDPELLLAPLSFVVDLQGHSDATDFHEVRRVLETESAGLAALRMDDAALARARQTLDDAAEILGGTEVDHDALLDTDIAFHQVIAVSSGNPVLAALVEALASRTARARLWRGMTQEGVEHRTHSEHEAIYAALVAGDPDRARLRMANHLLEVEDFVHTTPTP
ncbi:FadR/GntR family transcriptional regulator [Sanguibacter suarezii]|uniref:FadR/GntR family transcriptional regulator n=1 Tax=Sanguibacter suarezii TaxID=60921 RepID=UPI0008322548|nr:FadR/GntR family transcriptional regulator [Sanguibacter suarezii]